MGDKVSREEVQSQDGAALPDKEAMSLLDVNANIDLALDIAAPIDAAIAANANVAAPIDAAVGANVLSFDSNATAVADQGVIIDQQLDGEAIANATQTADLDQSEG